MSIKRPQLVNNEIYHLVLRGVSGSKIFRNNDDYWRAIFSIYEFNTTAPIEIRIQRKKRQQVKNGGLSSDSSDNRKLLIEILAFCFMPNHIHLLVRQRREDGITQFMRKFGTGYAYSAEDRPPLELPAEPAPTEPEPAEDRPPLELPAEPAQAH